MAVVHGEGDEAKGDESTDENNYNSLRTIETPTVDSGAQAPPNVSPRPLSPEQMEAAGASVGYTAKALAIFSVFGSFSTRACSTEQGVEGESMEEGPGGW